MPRVQLRMVRAARGPDDHGRQEPGDAAGPPGRARRPRRSCDRPPRATARSTGRGRHRDARSSRTTSPFSCRPTPRPRTWRRRCAEPRSLQCARGPARSSTTPAVLQWRLLLAALARPAPRTDGACGSARVVLRRRCRHSLDRQRRRRARRTPPGAVRAVTRIGCARVGVAAAYDELEVDVTASSAGSSPETAATATSPISITSPSCSPQRTHRANSEPAQVLRLLEEMIVSADEPVGGHDASGRVRRAGRADHHGPRAKGLEYPIVLVPFAFKCRSDVSTPFSYTRDGDARTIDVASLVTWKDDEREPGPLARLRRAGQRRRRAAAALRRAHTGPSPGRDVVGVRHAVAELAARAAAARSRAAGRAGRQHIAAAGARSDWKPPYQLLTRDEVERAGARSRRSVGRRDRAVRAARQDRAARVGTGYDGRCAVTRHRVPARTGRDRRRCLATLVVHRVEPSDRRRGRRPPWRAGGATSRREVRTSRRPTMLQ